jgi:aarF domain-containing kinase
MMSSLLVNGGRKVALLSSSAGVSAGTTITSTVPVLLAVAPRQVVAKLHGQAPRFFITAAETSATIHKTLQRYRQNGSKLYARYILATLALSAANAKSMRNSLSQCEGDLKPRPAEWGRAGNILEEIAQKELDDYKAGLGQTRVTRLWHAAIRMITLGALASPLVILAPLSKFSPTIEEYAWTYALWSVETAGPTFTKLAQWATTRSDLFPAEFIAHFAKLQDRTIGHAWKHTDDTLREALGDNYADRIDILASSQNTPIGSGCIAQVYKGTLKQPSGLFPAGTEIAIKVQHPGIQDKVFVDFYLLNKIATFLEKLPKLNLDYLSIRDSVLQFRSIMIPQLDLTCEARNLTRFTRDFANEEGVVFPQPIMDVTSKQVLVETFLHGEPILNYITPLKGAEPKSDDDKQALAAQGLEMVMKMIFLNDFVHGDLHPGNILIDRYGSRKEKLKLCILDCGLVVEMGEREHKNLVAILGALVKRDGYLAGELMIDTAKKCQADEQDVVTFCEGLERICSDDADHNFLEKVGDYLAEICYLACVHKVKLEASFINAALACEIMEGIATSLYPTMEVQSIALPMVIKAEVMHGMRKINKPKWFDNTK